MKESDYIQKSLPDDVAVKIASSLQASDLCSLGSCSKFWRELCKSDCLWESLAKQRWPSLGLFEASSSSSEIRLSQGWRAFYIERHNEMAVRAMEVVRLVEQSSCVSGLIEVGDYLKAIDNMHEMQLGFKDVEMLLFKPKFNSLLNLIGVHYCISWLKVPGEHVQEALQCSKISDRQVCVKWWKLGRWFYGFRMRDESRSRLISLADLATAKEEEVLRVLYRGAVHEVLRVNISVADPLGAPWYCQNTQDTGLEKVGSA